MKYLFTGLSLLALCLCLCVSSSLLLARYTAATNQSLEHAMVQAEGGDYDKAAQTVAAATAYWQAHQGFFGIVLRHDEADEVGAAFRALVRYATEKSTDEFIPNCAELMERISHLSKMERPSYSNVL